MIDSDVDSSAESSRQVRFCNDCALIPRDGGFKARPHLSTRSFSISLPMRWSATNSVYQLDCHANQRTKDPTLTLKLPSISTRPARRASISNDKEYAHIRSCMRRPSPSTEPTNLTFTPSAARGGSTAFPTSISPPTLPTLIEDTASTSDKVQDAPNPTPAPSHSSPFELHSNIADSSDIHHDDSATTSLASDTGYSSSPASSVQPLARSISPISYFTRRRGVSLSSAIPSQIDTQPLSSSSPPAHETTVYPSESQNSPPAHPSPTLSSSPTHTGADIPPHNHHYNLHVPFLSSTTIAIATIPLQPCCTACIATLEAHPSSLRPLASEKEAHWTARAWAKKKADEKEEEAIIASANVASAGSGESSDLVGEKANSQQGWSDEVLESMWTADVPMGAETSRTGANTRDDPVVVKRAPLSSASIKRNRELRESFSPNKAPSDIDAVHKQDGSIPEASKVAPVSTEPKAPQDYSEEERKCLDLVDLGMHALRVHRRLGQGTSDDDGEESSDEVASEEDEGGVVEETDADQQLLPSDAIQPVVSASSPPPYSSTHSKTASAPAATTSPLPESSPPPSTPEGKTGFMHRLRRGSASNTPSGNNTTSTPPSNPASKTSNGAPGSPLARSRSFPNAPPSPSPPSSSPFLRSALAKSPSNLGSITLNPFSSFGRLPGVAS